MYARDIEHCFSLLGEELEALGVQITFRLLMIGGGFMLTQIGNRDTTKDVDVRVQDFETLYYTHEYRIFKQAVRFVAQDNRLDPAWFSDNIGEFLAIAGPVPKGKLWRKFGRRLWVYVPPKDYILAHKLIAGRDKDEPDIEALAAKLRIKTRAQAQRIVNKYINEDTQQTYGVLEKINRFFRM
ncbi:MAG: hypothetical protein J2P37_03605 [Ktedonobacteraceae bacterium]|nr:hypothetical protein [Ktedonobacteraceae bacterium]